MSALLESTFSAVAQVSWQTSLVILLVLAVRPLLGVRVPAQWRYLLWTLVLVRLLVPLAWLPSSPVSLQNVSALDRPMQRVQLSVEQTVSAPVFAELAAAPAPVPVRALKSIKPAESVPWVKTSAPGLSWKALLGVIWALGVLVGIIYIVGAQMLYRRRVLAQRLPVSEELERLWHQVCRHYSVARTPQLWVSRAVSDPVLIGIHPAVLVLSEKAVQDYSREELQHILAHELGHFQRGDHWTLALHLGAVCLHWFNPLVWYGFAAARLDREMAADEWVLRRLEADPQAYGATLLKLSTYPSQTNGTLLSLGMADEKSHLLGRLRRIVSFQHQRWVGSIIGFLIVLIVAVIALSQATKKPFSSTRNLALDAKISTSNVSGWERLEAIANDFDPASSSDHRHGAYGNWPTTGTQWVQYDWDQPIATRSVRIYWWRDGQGIRFPVAARLLKWDGENYILVKEITSSALAPDRYNIVTFPEIKTSRLRLEFASEGSFSTGILQWKVIDSGNSPKLFSPLSGPSGENLALNAKTRTSYVSPHERLEAIQSGFDPSDSRDHQHEAYGNWPHTGLQWVQYEWEQPISTRAIDVYWWRDDRGIRFPISYRLLYWDGSNFVPVPKASGFGLAPDTYNRTTFKEIQTSKLRLEFTGEGTFSTGILQWKVLDSGHSPKLAPIINIGEPALVILDGEIQLKGSAKSRYNRVKWSKESGPGDVIFDDPNTLHPLTHFSQVGEYELKLTVYSGDVASSATTQVIVFNADYVWQQKTEIQNRLKKETQDKSTDDDWIKLENFLHSFIANYPNDPRFWDAKVDWLEAQQIVSHFSSGKPLDYGDEARQAEEALGSSKLSPLARSKAIKLAAWGKLMSFYFRSSSSNDLPGIEKAIETYIQDAEKAPENSKDIVFLRRSELDTFKNLAPDRYQALRSKLLQDSNANVSSWARDLVKQDDRVAELKIKPIDWKFIGVDGKPVNLSRLRGKVILVDFWATWCGPCRAETPHVKEAYEKFHTKGFEVIGISLDEDKQALLDYMKKNELPWPQFFDGKGFENSISRSVGINGIPTMWLFGKDGLLKSQNGRHDLIGQVEKLLATP